MLFPASCGCRRIAQNRRGHGRSSQPWNGGDDPIVPIGAAALRSAKLDKNAILKIRCGSTPWTRPYTQRSTQRRPAGIF